MVSRAGAVALLALAASAAAGCAGGPRSLYAWGRYEDRVYGAAVDPGAADPGEDARILGEDLERASAGGRPIPPGVRIHLAWLYLRTGNAAGAEELLAEEQEAFPESAVFVDRLRGASGP